MALKLKLPEQPHRIPYSNIALDDDPGIELRIEFAEFGVATLLRYIDRNGDDDFCYFSDEIGRKSEMYVLLSNKVPREEQVDIISFLKLEQEIPIYYGIYREYHYRYPFHGNKFNITSQNMIFIVDDTPNYWIVCGDKFKWGAQGLEKSKSSLPIYKSILKQIKEGILDLQH